MIPSGTDSSSPEPVPTASKRTSRRRAGDGPPSTARTRPGRRAAKAAAPSEPPAPVTVEALATGAGADSDDADVSAVIDQVIRASRRPPTRREHGRVSYSDRVLAAARTRFANDPDRAPISPSLLSELLTLLHEPGRDRSLVSSTFEYLARGMSMRHARVVIAKLRGVRVEVHA